VRVLVVDDEEIILSLAQKILTRAGCETFLADNGVEGLNLFSQNHEQIDLVILDISMEGLSGFDVLRRIRRISPAIPAIVSSGHPFNEDDLPDDLATNTCLLQKPYRSTALVNKVLEILRGPARVP